MHSVLSTLVGASCAEVTGVRWTRGRGGTRSACSAARAAGRPDLCAGSGRIAAAASAERRIEAVERATGRSAEVARRVHPRNRWYLPIGLLAAMMLSFTLSVIGVAAVSPFRPADENAHVGYVQALVDDGRLPVVGEKITPRFPAQPVDGRQHTANHPPLFYLMEAPIIWAGNLVEQPQLAFYVGRLLSALMGAVTVFLAGLIAFGLTGRRRPEVGIAAAVCVATFAPFVAVAGFFHNDTVGSATAALALLGLVTVALSRGRSL